MKEVHTVEHIPEAGDKVFKGSGYVGVVHAICPRDSSPTYVQIEDGGRIVAAPDMGYLKWDAGRGVWKLE